MVSVTFLKVCCQSDVSFSCRRCSYSGLVDYIWLEAFSFEWTIWFFSAIAEYIQPHTHTYTQTHTYTYIHLAGFFQTLSPNEPFASNSFFRPEISLQSSHPEKTTRVQPLLFSLLHLSFSSLFVFLLSFSFVTVILELFGLTKPYFWRLFTQMTANFVRLGF